LTLPTLHGAPNWTLLLLGTTVQVKRLVPLLVHWTYVARIYKSRVSLLVTCMVCSLSIHTTFVLSSTDIAYFFSSPLVHKELALACPCGTVTTSQFMWPLALHSSYLRTKETVRHRFSCCLIEPTETLTTLFLSSDATKYFFIWLLPHPQPDFMKSGGMPVLAGQLMSLLRKMPSEDATRAPRMRKS